MENGPMPLKLLNIMQSFLESSDSEDSSDEEAREILLLRMVKQPQKIPKIENYVDLVVRNLPESKFRSHFRMSRASCYYIIEDFQASQHYPSDKTHGGSVPITAETHILCFLWFAGNKCCLRDVSERFNVALSTAYMIIKRVTQYLLDIAPRIITFPKRQEEKLDASNHFTMVSGFPKVLGCIDGSYITIRTPAHKIKSTYANRHTIPSLTLQGICDSKKKFIDVFTGTPGKIHDSRVFDLSFISKDITHLCNNGEYHLLGDSAYPIREWLLTPYKDYGQLTAQQRRFNKKLSATRVLIENSFGLLKGRFQQLIRLDFHSVTKLSEFILSCCVLHNICIELNDDFEFELVKDDDEEAEALPDGDVELKRRGELKRDYICATIQ